MNAAPAELNQDGQRLPLARTAGGLCPRWEDLPEGLLPILLEQSPHPMWVSDHQGTLLKGNRALAALLQVGDQELAGCYNILEDTALEEQGVMDMVRSVFQDGREVRFSVAYDSSRVTGLALSRTVALVLDVSITPILNPRGRVGHAIIQLVDITRAKGAEDTLRKVSMALEQSPVSIVIADPGGSIEYVNPKFSEVSGYSAAEAIGQNTRILNSGQQQPGVYTALWATLGRGEVWEGDLHNRSKAGTLFWEHVKISPIRSSDSQVVAYVAVKEDITERRRAEAERRELTAQLHQSQKLESLGSLAGGVAHDLNNVLAAILSSASLHRDELTDQEPLARSLDLIVKASLRGREVVKSLLYFAHKDLETVGPVDLNDIAREIVQLMESATLRKIKVITELQEPLGTILGDSGALSHALMNLCVNAMDAMPGGGSITIRTRRLAEDRIQLSVRDTGHGMSAEVRKKAMDPFFTTKAVGKGTGLGLSMVYGTVKAHGGSLDILSELGLGTEVVLGFTGADVDAAELMPAPEQVADNRLRPLGILLVDDDELIREAISPMLASLGHRVAVAAGGLELLDRIQAGLEPDLVILDMNMADLGGAEVVPRLLALRPGQPVLLATGYTDDELSRLLAEYPALQSIRKPFTLEELRTRIEAVMGGQGGD